MKKILVTLLLAGLLLSACNVTITGSGDLETRDYDDLGSFDAISLSAYGTVYLKQGETTSVSVEADDNIFRYLEVDVRGKTLELGFKSNISISDITVVYTITTPNLENISISGAGQIFMEDFEIDNKFELNISGAGDVNIDSLIAEELYIHLSGAGDVSIDDGKVDTQRVTISGLGSYDASGMESDDAYLTISGAGDARVWAEESLDITISGAGDVRYTGDAKVSQSISGIGSVHED